MNKTLLQQWIGKWPEIRSAQPLTQGEGVIDQAAFDSVEVEALFTAVNHATTTVGQAVLFRSLAQPLANKELIDNKQAALKELEENPALKEQLENIISTAAEGEKEFYLLLFGDFIGSMGTVRNEHQIEGFGYQQYIRGTRFMLQFVDRIQALERPKSIYLKAIFEKIKQFSDSRPYDLMQGPVYLSEQGIQSKLERKEKFTPAVIFRPTLFKPLLFAIIIGSIWLFMNLLAPGLFTSNSSTPFTAVFFVPLLLIYIPIVGGFDRDKAVIPLRNIYKESIETANALDALGQLDELLSFNKYAESFGSSMNLPEMTTANHHQLNLSKAKNPILGKGNQDYVGNDIDLIKNRMIFITGPNSGGKTAFCKTVTQIQVLAQIGCYVPCDSATLSIADSINYQAPEISHLDDGEGRFGTELKRTKNIFLNCSEQSLVVLDELSEGTTFEEKMATSITVLDGFYKKGCSVLLITHNHQLVDHYIEKNIGLAKQAEFSGDAPTYKFIPGISRVSHADRIARKIGFAKADIENYLNK